MAMDLFYIFIGLVLLVVTGDFLVRGAVNLSLRLGVPALIVGLTIVGFGTSAPELLITVKSVLSGAEDLAVGNVVGSNIANVLLILGIPAILAPMATSHCDTRRSYIFMMCTTLFFIGLTFFEPLTWVHGILLLGGLAIFVLDSYYVAQRHRQADQASGVSDVVALEDADPEMPYSKIIFFLVIGLVGLPLGADYLIDGSVNIAKSFGVSEAVIGLTLVAIGTSLPELATTIMSALRRHAEVALGNVIGSNVFNILGVLGAGSLVGTISVDPQILQYDLWVMLGASLLLLPMTLLSRDVTRIWGFIFTGLYIVYLVTLVT